MTKKTVKKDTVMVRFPLQKNVHDDVWGIFMNKPREVTFEETLQEIMAEGVKAIKKLNQTR